MSSAVAEGSSKARVGQSMFLYGHCSKFLLSEHIEPACVRAEGNRQYLGRKSCYLPSDGSITKHRAPASSLMAAWECSSARCSGCSPKDTPTEIQALVSEMWSGVPEPGTATQLHTQPSKSSCSNFKTLTGELNSCPQRQRFKLATQIGVPGAVLQSAPGELAAEARASHDQRHLA